MAGQLLDEWRDPQQHQRGDGDADDSSPRTQGYRRTAVIEEHDHHRPGQRDGDQRGIPHMRLDEERSDDRRTDQLPAVTEADRPDLQHEEREERKGDVRVPEVEEHSDTDGGVGQRHGRRDEHHEPEPAAAPREAHREHDGRDVEDCCRCQR